MLRPLLPLLALLAALPLAAQSPKPTPRPDGQSPTRDARLLPPTPEQLARIEAALPAAATAKPKQPRRVLIFDRTEGFVHTSIPVANTALQRLGERTAAYSADVRDDMAAFDPANLRRYDAIVFNNTTRLRFADPAHRRALLDFVAAGKGVVGLHAATDNFPDWPEGQALIGGLFHNHPWGSGDTVAVKLDDPAHPLNQAFNRSGFWIQEEIYQLAPEPYSRDRQRVLLSLDMSRPENQRPAKVLIRPDNDFAISWIRPEGRGRVFYTSLGHREDIFFAPEVLEHLLDGIQFALGDLPADAVPSAKLNPPPAPALAPADKTTLQQKSAARAATLLPDAVAALATYRFGEPPDRMLAARDLLRRFPASVRAEAAPALVALLEKPDAPESVRLTVYATLPLVLTDAQVPALARLARREIDADPATRALAQLGTPAARDALLPLALDPANPYAVNAINALRRFPDGVTALALTRLISLPLSDRGAAALLTLASFGRPALGPIERLRERHPDDPALATAFLTAAQVAIADSAQPLRPFERRLILRQSLPLLAAEQSVPTRLAAANVLLRLPAPGAVDTLAPLLADPDSRVRRVATQELLRLGGPAGLTLVTARFPSLPADTRRVATATAGETRSAAALPLLQLALAQPELAPLAIRGLGLCAAPATIPTLIALLTNPDRTLATAAETALRTTPQPAAGTDLLAALETPGTPPSSQRQLLGILAARQHPRTFALALSLVPTPDPALRQAAFEALATCAGPDALPAILALAPTAAESRSSVRQAWRKALYNATVATPDRADATRRLAALLNPPGFALRPEIIGALSLIDSPEAADTLATLLQAPDPNARREALRALSAARTDRSRELLLAAAGNAPTTEERILALRGFLDTVSADPTTGASQRVLFYRAAWPLATRPEERAAILAAVRQLPPRNSAPFLKEFDVPTPATSTTTPATP